MKKALSLKAKRKVIAIIAAAGEGRRLGSLQPKIFTLIKDKPLLFFSLAGCSCHPLITEIILVCSRKTLKGARSLIKRFHFYKVRHIVLGGPTRKDSVANALKIVQPERNTFVLIHDAARPFLNQSLISRVLKGAFKTNAAISAVPVKCTIKQAKRELGRLLVRKTLERSKLWEIQTPQVFRADILKQAFSRFGYLTVTDDAMLVEKMNLSPAMVMGAYSNIKITTCEDLLFAQILAKRFNWRG